MWATLVVTGILFVYPLANILAKGTVVSKENVDTVAHPLKIFEGLK